MSRAAVAAVLCCGFFWTGCIQRPSQEELTIVRNWTARLDHDVMAYACPEARQAALQAEDPLDSATQLVHRGKQLELWATDPVTPLALTAPQVVAPLDSARAAVAIIASSFEPAVRTAANHRGECYGEFALNCTKLIRARDVFSRIDSTMLSRGLSDYLRVRSGLAELLAEADMPLAVLRSCSGSP